MAITFNTDRENTNKTTAFTGMVVHVGWEDVRVMSDVWAIEHYAITYDVANDKIEKHWQEGFNWKAEEDASPEVMQAYKDRLERDRRHKEAVRKWNEHNARLEQCHLLRITQKEWFKLNRIYEGDVFDGCYDLLKVKKFKNSFREAMATQLREWLANPEPKYKRPFSPRQEECILPWKARNRHSFWF